MATIVRRLYQLLVPAAQRDSLQAALDALVGSGAVSVASGLGPEAEPDCGYAVTITHYLGGPDSLEEDFQLIRTMIAADWPDAQLEERRWVCDDDGAIVVLSVEGALNLKHTNSLFDYDEAMAV